MLECILPLYRMWMGVGIIIGQFSENVLVTGVVVSCKSMNIIYRNGTHAVMPVICPSVSRAFLFTLVNNQGVSPSKFEVSNSRVATLHHPESVFTDMCSGACCHIDCSWIQTYQIMMQADENILKSYFSTYMGMSPCETWNYVSFALLVILMSKKIICSYISQRHICTVVAMDQPLEPGQTSALQATVKLAWNATPISHTVTMAMKPRAPYWWGTITSMLWTMRCLPLPVLSVWMTWMLYPLPAAQQHNTHTPLWVSVVAL